MIFLKREGRTLGPWDESELREQVAAGTVPASSMSWREGEPAWITLARRWRLTDSHAPPFTTALALAACLVAAVSPYLIEWLSHLPYGLQRAPSAWIAWALLAALPFCIAVAVCAYLVRQRYRATLPAILAVVVSSIAIVPSGIVARLHADMLEQRWEIGDADIRVDPANGHLLIDGPIGMRFASDVKSALRANPEIDLIVLNSDGGLIDDALEVAALISAHGDLTARVDGVCASACVSIWASAARREMTSESLLGLHQTTIETTLPAGHVEDLLRDSNQREQAFLKAAGFSDDVLAIQAATPPEEMFWLDAFDAVEEGIDLVVVE